jgi:hypothetical protein
MPMPYSAEISRGNPACFVFVLDQSGSMEDAFGGAPSTLRKADFLADVTNRTLHDLVIRCTKSDAIRDYLSVSIIGYGMNGGTVGSAFVGELAGRDAALISEIGECPARLEDRAKKVSDGAGGIVDQMVRFPIWIDARAEGGTPMCAALAHARAIVERWLNVHPNGYPPVVLHITDGESTDGDPTSEGQALMQLQSSDGHVLLFNCHCSSERSGAVEYPSDAAHLPNNFAHTLFSMSSVVPPDIRQAARNLGMSLADGARGFVFNADAASLVEFFDIGTRPANLR